MWEASLYLINTGEETKHRPRRPLRWEGKTTDLMFSAWKKFLYRAHLSLWLGTQRLGNEGQEGWGDSRIHGGGFPTSLPASLSGALWFRNSHDSSFLQA